MTNQEVKAAIIVARASNGVIGYKNQTPWQGNLPADMIYFQRLTYGQPVIMGRKTYESLPSQLTPLRGRPNIIISRNPNYYPRAHSTRTDYSDSEVFVVTNLEAAFKLCLEKNWLTPFIIGGGEIYALALQLPEVTRVYITEIGAEFPGNITFPELDLKVWERFKSWPHQPYDKNTLPFRWDVYRRIT